MVVQRLSGISLVLACACLVGTVSPISAQGAAAGQGADNSEPPKQAVAPVTAPLVAEEAIDPKQPLKPSFVINVSVEKEPEPSGNYVIDPSGNILLRIAEMTTPITVVGQTPDQAADVIATFLKKYIREPHVQVSIVAVPHASVLVDGAVKTPGPMIITTTSTLVDALSKATWTETADLSQVRLTRHTLVNGVDKKTTMTLHVDAYMRTTPGVAPDDTQNPTLQDKDSIFVPFKSLSGNGVITVSGEVKTPQIGMVLRSNPPLTLREAISLCGGVLPEANRKAISIRRANMSQPLLVDLDKAEQNDSANNIELRPDDTIYVEKLAPTLYYFVDGGVTKPGKYPFDKPVTLTQALIEAGGISPFAHDKQGFILRYADSDAKHTQRLSFNWRNILAGKADDVKLQPGDSIWIEPGAPSERFSFSQLLSTLTNGITNGLIFKAMGSGTVP